MKLFKLKGVNGEIHQLDEETIKVIITNPNMFKLYAREYTLPLVEMSH